MTSTELPAFLLNFADNQALKQVLPFWASNVINPHGGLYGAVDAKGQPIVDAEQGAIMNARALWSFSLAYEQTREPTYLLHAQHCYEAISENFIDPVHGGVFAVLDSHGNATDDNKILTVQSYSLFALSKFYQVHNDSLVLSQIDALLNITKKHFLRPDGTYLNGLARDFSDNDPAQQSITETCNQLHLLEALTQHYSVCPSPALKERLSGLIDLFLVHIFPAQDHLAMNFNRDWQVAGQQRSYGHNLEAPFLVHLACQVLGDESRRQQTAQQLLRLTDLTLRDGLDAAGNVLFGLDDQGRQLNIISWWPQTEASNALLLAYQLTGKEKYVAALKTTWQCIRQYWADSEHGEWHSELSLALTPAGDPNKAGLWRCAYHTTRACFALSRGIFVPKNNEPDISVA